MMKGEIVEQCTIIDVKVKEHDAQYVSINVMWMLAQDQATKDQAGKQGVKEEIQKTPNFKWNGKTSNLVQTPNLLKFKQLLKSGFERALRSMAMMHCMTLQLCRI